VTCAECPANRPARGAAPVSAADDALASRDVGAGGGAERESGLARDGAGPAGQRAARRADCPPAMPASYRPAQTSPGTLADQCKLV
jgi:hypothetical protein